MKFSFRAKLFLPLVVSWACLLAVMTVNVMRDKALRLEERQTQLRNGVEVALSVAKAYGAMASSGAMPVEQAQKQTLAMVSALRYGQSGYFTVFEPTKILMHPLKPSLAGTNPADLKDPDGVQICVEGMKAAAQPEGGFNYYRWPKPGASEPQPKMSYNADFRPWGWTFQTGAYVDDLNALFYQDLLRSAAVLAVTGLALTAVILLVVRNIERSVGGEPDEAAAIARQVAAGDLTAEVSIRNGDNASLMFAMKMMRDELATIVSQVRQRTDAIATASGQLATGNQDLSSRTEEQASALEETAASMEQLTSTVKQSADNARQADRLAASASDIAVKGGEVVGEVVNTMQSINDSARRVVDIISVIDGIAFQTNILALNAAVEAARAGEQGRGFAVVASEVRTLAQRSAAAAKEIKALIDDSVDKVDTGAALVAKAGSTMTEIVASIQRVTDIMSEINAASGEQVSGINEINRAVAQMDTVTQQNAALVEQAAAASESMQDQAAELARLVSAFKLGGASREAAAHLVLPGKSQARASALPPLAANRPQRALTEAGARAAPRARAANAPAPSPASGKDDWEEF